MKSLCKKTQPKEKTKKNNQIKSNKTLMQKRLVTTKSQSIIKIKIKN
jgi:hypothetical protein